MPNFPSPLTEPTLRDDLPRYPGVTQLIRVTATRAPGPTYGGNQVAGSSLLGPALYVAFTQQLRSDGSLLPRDREPCLADDVDGTGLSPGYYIGRLASSFNSLPVYEVGTGGGSTQMVRVTSTTPTGVFYPAVLQTSADGGVVWTDMPGGGVWAKGPNNEPLGLAIYAARGVGNGGTPVRAVFEVQDLVQFVRNNASEPDENGRYDATLQVFDPVARTWTSAADVWLVDGSGASVGPDGSYIRGDGGRNTVVDGMIATLPAEIWPASNTFLSGPSSGSSATAGFRAPVYDDIPRAQFSAVGDKTSGGSTTETSMVSASGSGSSTISANFFKAGRGIRIRAWGYITTSGTPTTIRVRIKLGATTHLDTGAVSVPTGLSNEFWELEAVLICRAASASGTVMSESVFRYRDPGVSNSLIGITAVNTAVVTVNTTVSQQVDITCTWGDSNITNSMVCTVLTIEPIL